MRKVTVLMLVIIIYIIGCTVQENQNDLTAISPEADEFVNKMNEMGFYVEVIPGYIIEDNEKKYVLLEDQVLMIMVGREPFDSANYGDPLDIFFEVFESTEIAIEHGNWYAEFLTHPNLASLYDPDLHIQLSGVNWLYFEITTVGDIELFWVVSVINNTVVNINGASLEDKDFYLEILKKIGYHVES